MNLVERMLGKFKKNEGDMKLAFLLFLYSFIGIPYKWGGDDPMAGFDCSGAVQEWLSYFGLDPKYDQTADDLYSHFNSDGYYSDQRGLGSLAFYGSHSRINHVAMMIDDERVIEFAGGGSNVKTVQDAIDENAFGRIRKLHYRGDLVSVIKPKGLPW